MSRSIEIGEKALCYLHIKVVSRCYPQTADFWDGNWLNTDIYARSNSLELTVNAKLRSDEFQSFLKELEPICKSLRGKAKFQSMEEWLEIHCDGDGTGHFITRVSVKDQPGAGNVLSFSAQLSEIQLLTLIDQLKAVLEEFPVVGK